MQGGHHASNIAVERRSRLASAQLSAYFMTSVNDAGWLQGGQYQGEAVPDGDKWRFRHYRIISGWGWRVEPRRHHRHHRASPRRAGLARRPARPATRPSELDQGVTHAGWKQPERSYDSQ